MLSCFRNQKYKTEEGGFLKNGAWILDQLIRNFDGNCNPIRTFPANELIAATNDYSSENIIHEAWDSRMYKGLDEDEHQVLVKKFEPRSNMNAHPLELISNEVAIASTASNHKNVLKLVGCCLETELPILVYEFPARGNLSHYIYGINGKSLPWHTRLKIVTQVSDAVAYLHYGTLKMILHRHTTCENIYLDQDYVAKLSEFQTSTPVPFGKSHIDFQRVMDTTSDSSVSISGRITEKTDVYVFGILLFETLRGKRWSNPKIWNVQVSNDGGSSSNDAFQHVVLVNSLLKDNELGDESKKQVVECAKLINMCLKRNPDDRPTITEVAQALRSIKVLANLNICIGSKT